VATARHDTYPAINPAGANLTGKVVLVTGASRGIGKASAVAFAQAGVSGLVLFARSDMEGVEAACRAAARPEQELRVLTFTVDITDASAISEAVKQVKATFGKLDIVVNNAGAIEPLSLIGDSDPETWWNVWTVNVSGTYQVTRAFLPLLIECGGDRTIFNIASIAALQARQYNSAYSVSGIS